PCWMARGRWADAAGAGNPPIPRLLERRCPIALAGPFMGTPAPVRRADSPVRASGSHLLVGCPPGPRSAADRVHPLPPFSQFHDRSSSSIVREAHSPAAKVGLLLRKAKVQAESPVLP